MTGLHLKNKSDDIKDIKNVSNVGWHFGLQKWMMLTGYNIRHVAKYPVDIKGAQILHGVVLNRNDFVLKNGITPINKRKKLKFHLKMFNLLIRICIGHHGNLKYLKIMNGYKENMYKDK